MELKLTAKNRNEEIILEHLKKSATDVLAEKINAGKKTLTGCWNFIVSEARQKAVSGCACIEDREVFGWALHYFEEDSIEECTSAPKLKSVTTSQKPSKKKEVTKQKTKLSPKPQSDDQFSLFDMLG